MENEEKKDQQKKYLQPAIDDIRAEVRERHRDLKRKIDEDVNNKHFDEHLKDYESLADQGW